MSYCSCQNTCLIERMLNFRPGIRDADEHERSVHNALRSRAVECGSRIWLSTAVSAICCVRGCSNDGYDACCLDTSHNQYRNRVGGSERVYELMNHPTAFNLIITTPSSIDVSASFPLSSITAFSLLPLCFNQQP